MRNWTLLFSAMLCFGCMQLEIDEGATGEKNASADAVFLEFEWTADLYTRICHRPKAAIEKQTLYTVGQLNHHRAVGRLDKLELSNIEVSERDEGGECRITYSAQMTVAWGTLNRIPETYEFIFPRDVSWTGLDEFVEKYTSSCLERGAHDVDSGVFWYYYRPERSGCEFDERDIVRHTAQVKPSATQTKGKYPEYDKVWEDNTFNVVAIFGMANDEGADNDIGFRSYRRFLSKVLNALEMAQVKTTPTEVATIDLGYTSTTAPREVIIEGLMPDGRKVVVNAFMIQSVSDAPSEFWDTYEELTPTADYIIYNGHSGLGRNIRKLAGRGVWAPGQYTIVFMNGCDTYAYIGSALNDAHAEVNDDDPEGTRYLDIVANAMPSRFIDMPEATMAIFDGLMSYDDPMTYEEILDNIASYEVALVTGEEDNEYTPQR